MTHKIDSSSLNHHNGRAILVSKSLFFETVFADEKNTNKAECSFQLAMPYDQAELAPQTPTSQCHLNRG